MPTETPDVKCLHCEQTRAQIKRDDTICGIEGGYEYRELEYEWPRHRWADWTDKELARFGIRTEAFAKHRRTPVMVIQYAPCADLTRGHTYPDTDNDWGDRADQCMSCGHTKADAHRKLAALAAVLSEPVESVYVLPTILAYNESVKRVTHFEEVLHDPRLWPAPPVEETQS